MNYWYHQSRFGQGGVSALPTQALSFKKKNRKWKEATLDALERIGVRQCHENAYLNDFYRMVRGDLSHQELAEVAPQLREVSDLLDKADVPTYVKHYDLIGIVVNALIGEYMQHSDSFRVDDIGEIATNEYLRDKKELLMKYVKEGLEVELKKRMLAMGLNPDPSAISDVKDPEQQRAYLEQIEKARVAKTPPEIQQHMQMDWRTVGAKWGQNTYTLDRRRFHFDELEREYLEDFLLTGRCFEHQRVAYDYYRPERWNPLNTFYSQDLETKHVEEGDYVGRVHFYTPNQFVDKYGHQLTAKQKEDILEGSTHWLGRASGGKQSAESLISGGLHEYHIIPHHNYYEHEHLVGMQDVFGMPLGVKKTWDKDGQEQVNPSYLTSIHDRSGFNQRFGLADSLKEGMNLRKDLICVTEAYWKSYRKVGYLTYKTPSGRVSQEIVTDELLTDFLKENEIKQLKTVTLEDLREEYLENTIVWDYIPETWKGVKASYNGFRGFGENGCIYLGIEPTEFQIRGDSRTYDVRLPVSGYISESSLAKKLLPDQANYNIARNQLYNFLEKEIGLFYIFDINFLPSEMKDWGDTEETLMHLKGLARDVGLFPVDASKGNIGSAGAFNQFSRQDLSLSSQMADRMQLAEYFKARLFEQVGFTPSRLGNPVKYETATGVQQSQNAAFAQTEVYFSQFSGFIKRKLETHLAVAQYCKKEGKDITLHYTTSDLEQSFLQISDPNFHLRHFGIIPTSNSKKRKNMETFKSHLLNTNTLGSDELALAELFSGESMSEMVHAARSARLKREEEITKARQHEQQMLQAQAEAKAKEEEAKWQRQEDSKKLDRKNKLDVRRIDALGRASDSNADPRLLDVINREADRAIQEAKTSAETSMKRQRLELDKKAQEDDREYKMTMLKLQMEKVRYQREKLATDKYIAEINKN